MPNLTKAEIEVFYKSSLDAHIVSEIEISILEKWFEEALNELDSDEPNIS